MRLLLSLLYIADWLVLSFLVHRNPSGTIPINLHSWVLPLQFGGALLLFLLFHLAEKTNSKRRFLLFIISSLLSSLIISTAAGIFVHRDYYSFFMPLLLAHIGLFIHRLDSLSMVKDKQRTYRALFYATLLVTLLSFSWIIIASYTIVVRLEPRWIESTWYNLFNALLAFCLLWSAATLWENRKKNVRVKDGRIYIDGIDYSESLSPQEIILLHLFLTSNSQPLNCSGLLALLRKEPSDIDETVSQVGCAACLEENYPPSKCASYRNLKNRITDIKKYLELMRIGTILPMSQNPRHIKERGWVLRFFDDVRML